MSETRAKAAARHCLANFIAAEDCKDEIPALLNGQRNVTIKGPHGNS